MLLLKLVPIRADRMAFRPHRTDAKRPPGQEKPRAENLERANGFEPSTLTLATYGLWGKAADLAVFLAKLLRTLEEHHANKCERTPKVLPSFG